MRYKTKPLTTGQDFSTKDDAFSFITGRKMANRMMLSETTDKHNVIFLQRGLATYTDKNQNKVECGMNHVYADHIDSLRAKEKRFRIDLNKPCLIFIKGFHHNNPALAHYTFWGEAKVSSVQSILSPNDYTTFTKTADTVKVKA